MRITASEEYGMRCMLQLARRPDETVSITELAATEGIAVPFAAKVLLALRRAGLVLATRGRHGGYRLASDPQRITAARILQALGKPLFDSTFCRLHAASAQSGCARLTDCSLRPVWAHLDRLIVDFFAHTTLADLLATEQRADDQLQQRWPLVAPAAWQSKDAGKGIGADQHAINR